MTTRTFLEQEIDIAVSGALRATFGRAIDECTPLERQAAALFVDRAASFAAELGDGVPTTAELRRKLDCVGLFQKAMRESVVRINA